ncbi:putative ABC transporter permease protein [Austwickia chelonae NBRC 105200]|uniref:Putative ABC transporter permease protein n=2 Tax=Austwickia TaxID=1184606 RepID=K6VP95_9MICO|nr:putative ABC transporter permease protein [Austwickia chelonae NBRC 105200]
MVTILSNGEQLLVSVVLPVFALVGLVFSPYPDVGGGSRVEVVMPGVLALALLSSAFTGQAIGTGFDRRYGVLRLLGTTPLGRDGFLCGRVLAVLFIQVVQFAVLGVAGGLLGWRPSWSLIPGLGVFWVLGTSTFVAMALLLAGTLRAEAVLALANLLWVVMAFGGAVLLPAQGYPRVWSVLVGLLPPGALGEGLRAAAGGSVAVLPMLVLACWGAALVAATVRFFRWSD